MNILNKIDKEFNTEISNESFDYLDRPIFDCSVDKVKMYKKGFTIYRIAKKYKVSFGVIKRRICKK